jgi:hypothetical protein
MVAKIPSLGHLDLSLHGFGDDVARTIASGLEQLPSLREVSFNKLTLSSASALADFYSEVTQRARIQALGLPTADIAAHFANPKRSATDFARFRYALSWLGRASTRITRVYFYQTGADFAMAFRTFALSFPVSCQLEPPEDVFQFLSVSSSAGQARSIRSPAIGARFGQDSLRFVPSPYDPFTGRDPLPFVMPEAISTHAQAAFERQKKTQRVMDRAKGVVSLAFLSILPQIDAIREAFSRIAGAVDAHEGIGKVNDLPIRLTREEFEHVRRKCKLLQLSSSDGLGLSRSVSSGTFESATADESMSEGSGVGMVKSESVSGAGIIASPPMIGLVKSKSAALGGFVSSTPPSKKRRLKRAVPPPRLPVLPRTRKSSE